MSKYSASQLYFINLNKPGEPIYYFETIEYTTIVHTLCCAHEFNWIFTANSSLLSNLKVEIFDKLFLISFYLILIKLIVLTEFLVSI